MSIFNTALEKIFLACEALDTYDNDGAKRPRPSENPVTRAKSSYKKIYNHPNTKEEKFMDTFRPSYKESTAILFDTTKSLDDFMSWFETAQIKISVSDRAYIPLSMYFKKSCTIARSIHKKTQLDDGDTIDPICSFPEHFCLHLIRIYSTLGPNNDEKTILDMYISDIEKELDIQSGENPQTDDFLGNMIDMASTISSTMGIPLPTNDNGSPINAGELRNAIGGVMSNPQIHEMLKSPQTQQLMQGLMGSMAGGKEGFDLSSIGNIVSSFTNTMRENADTVPEAVTRSIEAVSEDVE